jgi:hypothetical protein
MDTGSCSRVSASAFALLPARDLPSIYSGQTGFDIYTRAISDAYQDLYGEGIFTGKGIYEVAPFMRCSTIAFRAMRCSVTT